VTVNHLLGSLDFLPEEYNTVFSLASRIIDSPMDYANRCSGRLMATLFYEPSTRTRLSFEAAMLRLGGGVISVANAKTRGRRSWQESTLLCRSSTGATGHASTRRRL